MASYTRWCQGSGPRCKRQAPIASTLRAPLALSAVTYLYQVRMKTLYTTSSSVAHHLPMELASRGDEEAIARAPSQEMALSSTQPSARWAILQVLRRR